MSVESVMLSKHLILCHCFLLVCLQSFPASGFSCGSAGKEYACNEGDLGSIPGLGRSPGEGKGYLPVSFPGEFRGLYRPNSELN